MAYNIFAETDKQIDWEELNKKVVLGMSLEYVPMPGMGINGGDALGISIPAKRVNGNTWEELKKAIEILKDNYNFSLYDMYYGKIIDSKMMNKVKENLTI